MDGHKAKMQKVFAQEMQTYWRTCGFDSTTPLYEFEPRLSRRFGEIGFFDFARSCASRGMVRKETVTLAAGAALYRDPFQMVVIELSPIAPPVDVLSDGTIVYSRAPNWFGQGYVVPISDPQAIRRVRFVICIGDNPDQITKVFFDFFVD